MGVYRRTQAGGVGEEVLTKRVMPRLFEQGLESLPVTVQGLKTLVRPRRHEVNRSLVSRALELKKGASRPRHERSEFSVALNSRRRDWPALGNRCPFFEIHFRGTGLPRPAAHQACRS